MKGYDDPIATKKNKRTKKQLPKKICLSCPEDKAEKTINNFYTSNSKMHQDGYIPYCKSCILDKAYNYEKDNIDVEKLKSLLRQIDKPFINTALQSAINQYKKAYKGKEVGKYNKKKIIQYYFKNIQSLPQYSGMTWEDGFKYEKENSLTKSDEDKVKQIVKSDDRVYLEESDDFKVTPEIVKLFGEGYTISEYRDMWKKYEFLSVNYPKTTNFHVEALVSYVKYKVKEETAVLEGNVAEADKWYKMSVKAAEKAKINPDQLSKSDLQGGLNSYCELIQAVEEAVDVIPILPEFKFSPRDAVDFNIYCYINYLRDLEGKPLCSYEDIYKFYDERKQEYIKTQGDPYGIFTDDPTESNRENIKKFITLPNDYYDDDLGGDADDTD